MSLSPSFRPTRPTLRSQRARTPPVGPAYAYVVDMRKPYRVYGGLQDNGTWGGPSTTRDAAGISIAHWHSYLGYDGYYCVIHPQNDDILYCEGQYGIFRRINV